MTLVALKELTIITGRLCIDSKVVQERFNLTTAFISNYIQNIVLGVKKRGGCCCFFFFNFDHQNDSFIFMSYKKIQA